ncbi:3-oxoacyl-ACP reductase [Aeromonas hydrophila]|uniref:3-oxoacyl-ACP reductase n=1 Tax=Aeromonas hydrophila TaxID=644 RepID=UPI00208E7605|nr:3-oxoacyl-ACP reductase [Aeromonas hydrophila]MCO4198564.1 3-oxoacyl-ACP reductase [Aeromonas hydrophila]
MNKVALVTGCSAGIGAEIVKCLSEIGYKVIATYNNTIPNYRDEKVLYRQLDVTDQFSCKQLLEDLISLDLAPDVLVNNAGVVNDSMFHKMEYSDWYQVINVNLLSLFNLTQPIFSAMRNKNYGRIVNISSVNANKGQIGQANYCAAKAGILGFTKALALEGARFGITVNAISPGYTNTEMVKNVRPDVLENIIGTIPLQRLCRPDEVAALVCYLVSDNANYITGANYEINGGLYLS